MDVAGREKGCDVVADKEVENISIN